ncbi:ribonuclease HII [Hydrogenophilus islandicus]
MVIEPWQIGVDEVGRGPWAGPVCAAAVVLGEGWAIPGLRDSKALTPAARERLAQGITAHAFGVALGWASVAEIDTHGIWPATVLAMTRAVEALLARFPDDAVRERLLAQPIAVDGNRLPHWPYAARAVVRGDGSVAAIAAASIVAKVARDRWMVALDERYPGYGFARHKGYGTREHAAALARLGVTPEHRRSFRPVAAYVRVGDGR